eukprot:GHUV01047892.1.p1 GENE.GHUV01047892.1~~GHUV01047892.1.p1  ORF type:complete len:116 (-),score=21.91 GHUV01047892.1:80-427(-)
MAHECRSNSFRKPIGGQCAAHSRSSSMRAWSRLLGLAALLVAAAAKGGEFSPSVVLTTVDEMQNYCDQMVDNALKLNSRNIKFVPTVHYYGSETHLNSFCYRSAVWETESRQHLI